MACIGLLTKITSWTSTLLCLYVFLIPALFGKINHAYHHVFWFALLIAAAPSGKALSVDALFPRRKIFPPKHFCHALSLRMAWLLFGLIYFFPGFWKLWDTGWYWALSDNLTNTMHRHWMLREITPFFRIDSFPLAVQLGALSTMLFEMSAPLLVLFPQAHIPFIFMGLGFHLSTQLFLGINFQHLSYFYFIFIPWDRLFHSIGKTFSKRKAALICVATDDFSIRVLNSIKAFDLFSMIKVMNEESEEKPETYCSRTTWSSFSSAFKIMKLTPLILWAIPLIVISAGQKSLKHKNLDHRYYPKSFFRQTSSIMGIFLITAALYCGITKFHSWPFTYYPTFSHYQENRLNILEIKVYFENSKAKFFRMHHFKGLLKDSHFGKTQDLIIYKKRRETAAALIKLLQKRFKRTRHAKKFEFYLSRVRTAPKYASNPPEHREKLFELPNPKKFPK